MGKKKSVSEGSQKKAKDDQRKSISEKIERLCKCNKILSSRDMHDFGKIAKYFPANTRLAIKPPCDECKDESLETITKFNDALAIPYDPDALVTITTNLSKCPKFEIRTGTKHMRSLEYSVLSRGFQGVAIAASAIATSHHIKPTCWNCAVINQVIDDGDLWFCESYEDIQTSDRRSVTLRDLRNHLKVQREHQVTLDIGEPIYAGTFRSENPTIMHVARALMLFFDNYDVAVLTSSVLNVALWRTEDKYSFFDGQPRTNQGEIITEEQDGDSAKLIIVNTIEALLHFILEKSNVKNESFVIFSVKIGKTELLSSLPTEEEIKALKAPRIRTSGFIVREKYRAVLKGSYHLEHHFIPEELRTRGHLTFALGALIYTKLVETKNWSKVLIDLILNQSNIYLIDLARALDKKLDETFELTINELLGDVMLGVYTAKVKVDENVVPGQTKGKVTIDVGIRTFFDSYTLGLIELKGIYYAVWRVNEKYYLLDPFACDEDGFRVDPDDEESREIYKKASACVTMNSSLVQLLEILMKNTDSKDKDPFFIHGLSVLYIKAGSGCKEKVVYREGNIKRRPEPEQEEMVIGECEIVDTEPKPRPQEGTTTEEVIQYPDPMERIDKFITSYEETVSSELVKIKDYKVVNPNRIILKGTKNCLDKDFKPENQGQQGIVTAIAAVAQSRLICTTKWDPAVIDQIIVSSNSIYEQLVEYIETYVDFDEMRLSMIPKVFEYQENQFHFGKRSRVLRGISNPLANLGEALERYFGLYEQMILENKKRHYCIWKRAEKYALFNPYGCDEEGWQNITKPAALVIVDSIVELVNVLYGTLDYYENEFVIHYFDLVQKLEGDDKEVDMPKIKPFGKFNTKFLPLTNDDLVNINPEVGEDDDDSVFMLFDATSEPQGKRCRRIRKKANDGGLAALLDAEEEPKQPDPPKRLNLALVTGMVKVEPPQNEEEIYKKNLEAYYEKLKYEHPPPFTTPPQKNVCNLVSSKLASQSVHSLISRFSIDSKLSVKEKNDPDQQFSIIKSTDEINKTSLITLPPEKFFYSNRLPNGLTPIRAVDEMFIKNEIVEEKKIEECQLKTREKEIIMVPEEESPRMLPTIIPLGPIIRTPIYIRNPKDCPDKIVRSCPLSAAERKDAIMRKLVCGTENLLLEIMAPGFNSVCDKKERVEPDEIEAATVEQESDVVVKQEPGVALVKQEPGVVVKQEPGAAVVKQEPGVAIKQEPGSVVVKQEPSGKAKRKSGTTVKQEPGTTVVKQEPGTTVVKQEPGTTVVKQEPGTAVAKQEPGTIADIQEQENRKIIKQLKLIFKYDRSGFVETDDKNIGIIKAGLSIANRDWSDDSHYQDCFYASIFCIMAKINMSVNNFNRRILDYLIVIAEKIGGGIGDLRVVHKRSFHNAILLNTKCNIIIKEARYADPESSEFDDLSIVLCEFLTKHKTGIISFINASFAFWEADDLFYLFDPYACDENGRADPAGRACVMRFCNFEAFYQRLKNNAGTFVDKPFRLHSIAIAHLERIKKPIKKLKVKCKVKETYQDCVQVPRVQKPQECKPIIEEPEEEEEVLVKPLIEKIDWLEYDKIEPPQNCSISGFQAIPNYHASALEVDVLENDPTRPILGPLRPDAKEMIRMNSYDREFHDNTFLAEPMSLCIMAWAQIYDPAIWSIQTLKGLYEACKEYSADSLFAADDTGVNEMFDDLLTEFNIANYTFRVVFAPMHSGTLYATSGWNLAISLKRIFDSPIYTGAVLCCGEKFYGVMKRGRRYYAWWLVKWTKNIRIIVTEDMQDYLKLLVKDLDQNVAAEFSMRIVTISYAVMVGPNCGDVDGLHKSMMPKDSIPQVYRKNPEDYDPKDIFKPIDKNHASIFVRGSVALNERDKVTEPKVKRCYFVALLAVLMKRDLIQNPIPAMVDKIVELGEAIYKLMPEPKYHTGHILKDANLMNRTFEFCDIAMGLVRLQNEKDPGMLDFFTVVRTALKQYFEKRTSGIIHFTNCCYGFWYSEATECYYYLDPYQCNQNGRRVETCGKSCFCVFSTLCDMVNQMCANKFPETTGFFIHEIHVEAVNTLNDAKFVEDPIWAYLDYHWSQRHYPPLLQKKKPCVIKKAGISVWKGYVVEVPSMIYSLWGTIGTFDPKFDHRAGKNQAAIAVCAFAMRNLCHPSEWTSAILDSIVIWGDKYYTESKKSNSKCRNRFHLGQNMNISPFQWYFEFLPGICGILYGEKNKRSLSEAVSVGLKRQPQLLLQCGKKFVAILQTTDGYYAVDSSWTGPPLFRKNHGAIYSVRCKNTNILIYVLTKMLNTNQKVGFTVTPLKMDFKQEIVCKSAMSKNRMILFRPIKPAPGKTVEHPSLITGSVAVPEEDSYLLYNKRLKLGLEDGHKYEMSEITKVQGCCKSKKAKTSCGRKKRELEVDGPYDEGPSILYRKVSLPKQLDLAKYAIEEDPALKRQNSLYPEIISAISNKYTVDLMPGVAGMAQVCSKVSSKGTCPLMDKTDKSESKPDRDCASGIEHYGPIGWQDVEEIDLTNSFIADKTRQEFKKFNQELSKDLYKEEKQMTEQEYNDRMNLLELTSTSSSDDCNKTSAPCTQKKPE